MTIRMHPVSADRWAQLAASRRPIDLVEEEAAEVLREKGHRRRDEHAEIQAQIDAVAARRIAANR